MCLCGFCGCQVRCLRDMDAIFMAAVMMMLCSCGNNATGQDSKSSDDNGQTEVRQEETDAAVESERNTAEENDSGMAENKWNYRVTMFRRSIHSL